MVCSTFWVATSLPSTSSRPVPEWPMPLRLTEILAQVMELEHLIVQRSAFTGPNASHGARLTLVLSVKPQLHLEERCLRVSQPTRAPYFTNSISLGRRVLSKNGSFWLWEAQKYPYTISASTGTPSHFAAASRSVNRETCSGEWSVNMACNFT